MIHIHPFPARMAPDIVLDGISSLKPGQRILDPMTGSGMVINNASRAGLVPIGVDLDPLARLISKVSATRIDASIARQYLSVLLEKTAKSSKRIIHLPWIDEDTETAAFIKYWFNYKQEEQLRNLSFNLFCEPCICDVDIMSVIQVAISRLIITKDPKASLARDTAHSRPHRVSTANEFDILAALPESLEHVLLALKPSEIKCNATVYSGDARKLDFIVSNSIDAIITSPPYLNAIDYMRGHKLSLVWFGHKISELRNIRGEQIGAEASRGVKLDSNFCSILEDLGLWSHECRTSLMLQRYYYDLKANASECVRVLKAKKYATFVIGNSEIQGRYVQNSELLKRASLAAGFSLVNEGTRDIPDSRRYMPINSSNDSTISKRMRTEHVITFVKTSKKSALHR
jgi:hypothetical protein